jgi:tRNA-uridine 2-sulfurtransferase
MIDKYNIKLLPPSLSPWVSSKPLSKQIAVLMSGGVDSSTTANMLKADGWDVLGITMKIPTIYSASGCGGSDVVSVCKQLDIPHYFVDVAVPFEQLVIEPFRQSYAKGQTPNPCVDCNRLLKFSLVWDLVKKEFGIEYLASGHYAQIIEVNGQFRLARAKDKTKDQSYFLHGIVAERLSQLILPLGKLTKKQVRLIAAGLNLTVAEKPESMELCFTSAGDYRIALTDANRQGDITDMQGNKIGTHRGIANYTIGQRRGIGFAGGKPLYVGRIDAGKNTIALGTREEISFPVVCAKQVNVLIPEEFRPDSCLFGKVRSYNDPLPCKVVIADKDGLTVEFAQPLFAPTPGQKLVLYNSDEQIVAGGTIIASSQKYDRDTGD